MSYCGNKMLKRGLLILPMVALLAGCGPDGKDDNSNASAQAQETNEPSVQIAGSAMKGVIRQGIVTAKRLMVNQSGRYSPGKLAAKAVRTADDGSYQLRLPGKAEGWALVEIRADQSTRMVCDVVPSCYQAGGEPVLFGETLTLESDFILRGAGDLTAETVYLTPLTHLAVTLAERNTGGEGLSPTALTDAYEAVEGWFGLTAGALAMAPPDLTQLDQLNEVSADGLQVAIANAAFLALVNDNAQWQNIADVLNDMSAQIVDSGQIDILGDGVNLAMADIISVATLQASELQMMTDSGIVSQKLAIVVSRNVHRFKTIADVYEESDTSVADTVDESPASDNSSEEGLPANTALLSWTAPMTRVNGESLSMGEIAGFEVVYGTNAEALNQTLAIGDASIDELLVDQLDAGTWYFAIRTLDTDGNRSQLSEVVNKQI